MVRCIQAGQTTLREDLRHIKVVKVQNIPRAGFRWKWSIQKSWKISQRLLKKNELKVEKSREGIVDTARKQSLEKTAIAGVFEFSM